MILALSTYTFTALHVGLSLLGIVSGLIAFFGLVGGRWLGFWHHLFLASTLLTVVTGFLFPVVTLTPALVVGGLTTIALVIAYTAIGRRSRWLYALSGMTALYLNLFVLVAQGFLKVPKLASLAPTQTELPFAAAQILVLFASLALGFYALRGARDPA